LVNLTRVFLRQPAVWLLDEPTASMDRNLELKVTAALKASLQAQDTLVLVTHKGELLELVDRLIVIANHQVLMDGPKQQVLARLQTPQAAEQAVGSESAPATPATSASGPTPATTPSPAQGPVLHKAGVPRLVAPLVTGVAA
jgi:ATP-binding cassette subfamily C protein LapB